MTDTMQKKILPINIQYLAESTENADTPTEEASNDTKDLPKNTEAEKSDSKKIPEKMYSQKDVDNLLNKRFEEWSKKRNAEVDEADKLAKMNETEKAIYERDKLKKELEEYKSREQLGQMTKTARNMLQESGISISDELLAMIVTTDAEKTKSAVNSFAKMFGEALEKAVREQLKGNSPKSRSKGNGGSVMTVEKIMNIKDPVERQQAIMDNRELFNI